MKTKLFSMHFSKLSGGVSDGDISVVTDMHVKISGKELFSTMASAVRGIIGILHKLDPSMSEEQILIAALGGTKEDVEKMSPNWVDPEGDCDADD